MGDTSLFLSLPTNRWWRWSVGSKLHLIILNIFPRLLFEENHEGLYIWISSCHGFPWVHYFCVILDKNIHLRKSYVLFILGCTAQNLLVNPTRLDGRIDMQMLTNALLLAPNMSLPSSIIQTRWISKTRHISCNWYWRICGLTTIPIYVWLWTSLVWHVPQKIVTKTAFFVCLYRTCYFKFWPICKNIYLVSKYFSVYIIIYQYVF